jgi:hypothetical protein
MYKVIIGNPLALLVWPVFFLLFIYSILYLSGLKLLLLLLPRDLVGRTCDDSWAFKKKALSSVYIISVVQQKARQLGIRKMLGKHDDR